MLKPFTLSGRLRQAAAGGSSFHKKHNGAVCRGASCWLCFIGRCLHTVCAANSIVRGSKNLDRHGRFQKAVSKKEFDYVMFARVGKAKKNQYSSMYCPVL